MSPRTSLFPAILVASLTWVGCGSDAPPPLPERFAVLAVGDTGVPPDDHDGQAAVARAIAFEDARRPTRGLILLGDNFYPDGLRRDELAARVGHNLVSPYCRFVELGPRASETGSPCTGAASGARSVWAVLGNHDHVAPESPALQRDEVVHFVANWRMNRDTSEVHEVAPGVQLILADSERLLSSDPASLTRTIDAAPGPWRILVSHIPLHPGHGEYDELTGPLRALSDAIGRAREPVQLALAGHEHNLQVYAVPGRPGLSVIAGGGSGARNVHEGALEPLFAREARGFARVSVLDTSPERLRVELFAAPRWVLPGLDPVRSLVRYEISLAGVVSEPGANVNR